MALTPQDVSRIAHLARLELLFWQLDVRDSDSQAQAQHTFAAALRPVFGAAADEQTALLTQLNGFFSIVEQMSKVDTRGVEPLYTPLSAVQDVTLRLREDRVTEAGDIQTRELNQRSAPAVEDGLFLVPKVIE